MSLSGTLTRRCSIQQSLVGVKVPLSQTRKSLSKIESPKTQNLSADQSPYRTAQPLPLAHFNQLPSQQQLKDEPSLAVEGYTSPSPGR